MHMKYIQKKIISNMIGHRCIQGNPWEPYIRRMNRERAVHNIKQINIIKDQRQHGVLIWNRPTSCKSVNKTHT